MTETATVPQQALQEESCHECGAGFVLEETYCGICGRQIHRFCGCPEHAFDRIRYHSSYGAYDEQVDESDGPCMICKEPVLPQHNVYRGRFPAVHDSCLEVGDIDEVMAACNAADDIEVRLDEDGEQAAFEDSEIDEVEKVLNRITRIKNPNNSRNRDRKGRCLITDDSRYFA